MFDHLLLLSIVLLVVALLRALRGTEGPQHGYTMLLAGQLCVAIYAMSRQDLFFGTIALCFCGLTVVVPQVLEWIARLAFRRQSWSWMLRLAQLRSLLMPGAGLSRQVEILRSLDVYHRQGVDAALEHLKGLAEDAEEGGDLTIIHEQIIAMLFQGQRWDEGIAYYERRFHPGYAAVRPALALGLLQAYGEAGRLHVAAGLLRALEEGPIGADPRTAGIIGQAQFTFLAYSGASQTLDHMLQEDRSEQLGLTPATMALLHGIALARAGHADRALGALRKVETLAGPKETRVLEVSRSSLMSLKEAAIQLEPELRTYVQSVARRLQASLRTRSELAPTRSVVATYFLIAAFAAVFGVQSLLEGGGEALLKVGVFAQPIWQQGIGAGPSGLGTSWARVFTSPWLHRDMLSLLFDVYALWLGGQLIERTYGSVRMILVAVLSAIVGVWGGAVLEGFLGLQASSFRFHCDGDLLAVAVLTAALWTIVPSRSPHLTSRGRRQLLVMLGLLFLAHWMAVLPGPLGSTASGISLALTVLVASICVLTLPRAVKKTAKVVEWSLLSLLLLSTGWSFSRSPRKNR